MKLSSILPLLTPLVLVQAASAVTLHNQTISDPAYLEGTGNVSTHFTTSAENGTFIALRAKTRFPDAIVDTTNHGGVFTFVTPTTVPQFDWNDPEATNNSVWSFDFSVTSPLGLDAYDYRLDITSTSGVTISFDFINDPTVNDTVGDSAFDHTLIFGDGSGEEDITKHTKSTSGAIYQGDLAGHQTAQNSWNMGFFDTAGDFFGDQDDSVTITITILDKVDGTEVNTASITVNQIPEPSALFLGALGLLPLIRRKR